MGGGENCRSGPRKRQPTSRSWNGGSRAAHSKRRAPASSHVWSQSNEASSDRQFIQDQKLYLAIFFFFFLNKCIQVQLKAFQLCQVLVE